MSSSVSDRDCAHTLALPTQQQWMVSDRERVASRTAGYDVSPDDAQWMSSRWVVFYNRPAYHALCEGPPRDGMESGTQQRRIKMITVRDLEQGLRENLHSNYDFVDISMLEGMLRYREWGDVQFLVAEGLLVRCMVASRSHLQRKVFLRTWIALVKINVDMDEKDWRFTAPIKGYVDGIDRVLDSDQGADMSNRYQDAAPCENDTVLSFAVKSWDAIMRMVFELRCEFAERNCLILCAPS